MTDRHYIEIPGSGTHELPPLLVRGAPDEAELGQVVDLATGLVDAEDMVPTGAVDEAVLEQRRFELALNLAYHYQGLITHWQWGDSILEWIRQCEITFETVEPLRRLLHPDVWPHAGRASFVNLLADKQVHTGGVALEKAVGLRLTFRHPPPIDCFSNQFLFYLNSPVAGSAYHTWAQLNHDDPGLLPPHRFSFRVLEMTKS